VTSEFNASVRNLQPIETINISPRRH